MKRGEKWFLENFWKFFHLQNFLGLGGKICISAQEARRDFSDVAKCSQSSHLYTTYEATYSLKCMV